MKKLLLLIIILFGCTPKIECPKCAECPKPEKNYREKMQIQSLIYAKKELDKRTDLTKAEKDIYMTFVKCYRDILSNPYTLKHLMTWQRRILKNMVTEDCINFLREEYWDISPLMRVLEKARAGL